MNESQGFVLGSLAINIAIWGIRLFSMPSVQNEFIGHQLAETIQAGIAISLYLAIACWPWIAAWFKAAKDMNHPVVLRLFLISAASSIVLTLSSLDGPQEGVAYALAIHILLVWISYPFMAMSPKPAT